MEMLAFSVIIKNMLEKKKDFVFSKQNISRAENFIYEHVENFAFKCRPEF